jgi:ABC-2 type transport system permease protein
MRALVLARNEAIKIKRRSAFWVAFWAFTGLMALVFGSMRYQSAHPQRVNQEVFALPGAWREILGGPGVMAAFFAAMVLMLLVASEFTWRTARQNVIDGLSKEEFFAGKLLLLPAVGLLFFGVLILVGGGIALSASHDTAGPLVRGIDAEMIGGALVGLFGWGALAFLLAVVIRSSGPAIGAFFLYFLIEQILGQLIAHNGSAAATVTRYFPTEVFKALWQPASYLAVPRPGQPPSIAPSVLMWVSAAYIVALLSAAFALYRRRDL